jgi:hypothetical protein
MFFPIAAKLIGSFSKSIALEASDTISAAMMPGLPDVCPSTRRMSSAGNPY